MPVGEPSNYFCQSESLLNYAYPFLLIVNLGRQNRHHSDVKILLYLGVSPLNIIISDLNDYFCRARAFLWHISSEIGFLELQSWLPHSCKLCDAALL